MSKPSTTFAANRASFHIDDAPRAVRKGHEVARDMPPLPIALADGRDANPAEERTPVSDRSPKVVL
jgi:hypothetical protein